MRFSRSLAVLVSAGLLFAACGDDAGDDAGTDPAPSTTAASASPGASPGSGEQAGGTVTIEHYSGTDEVPVDPETVVVMDMGILLSLDALGVEVDGYGGAGAVPAEHQELVDGLEPVGTAFEPDYESINALEPDLIIVATRSSETYPEMKEIAPTVDLTLAEDVDFLTALRDRHEAIGQIFGVEDEVETALSELEARADDIATRAEGAGDALVVMTSGAEVSAYGPGSRFGLVHDLLGFAPADETLTPEATHGEAVSFEYVLESAPDVLFVIDRAAAIGEEGQAAEQVLDNELVRQTPAWQDDRVVYADSFAWYIVSHSLPGLSQILDDAELALS
jgi:iron complex transport system substrate-binding protein